MSFSPANRALSRLCRRKPNDLRATAKRVPAQGRHLAVALFITAYCLSVFLSETQKRDRKIGIPLKQVKRRRVVRNESRNLKKYQKIY